MNFRVAFKYRYLKLSMYKHTNCVVNPEEKLKLAEFCVPDRMKIRAKPIRHELGQYFRPSYFFTLPKLMDLLPWYSYIWYLAITYSEFWNILIT